VDKEAPDRKEVTEADLETMFKQANDMLTKYAAQLEILGGMAWNGTEFEQLMGSLTIMISDVLSMIRAVLNMHNDTRKRLDITDLRVNTSLQTHEERLQRLENRLVSEITQFADVLSQIQNWMKEYQPTLDEAKKDYGNKLGKVTKF